MNFDLPTIDIERLKIGAHSAVSAALLREAEIHVWRDHARDQIVHQLESLVSGVRQRSGPVTDRHAGEVTFDVPASWWQAFKLAAIEAGNPFFDPAKVRMRTETRQWAATCTVTAERFVSWPEIPAVPRSWGSHFTLPLPATRTWEEGTR